MDSLKLEHYQEFKEVLANYQLSNHAKAVVEDLRLVLLIGPSASGRNTLIRELQKSGDYYFIVSDTTRLPEVRDGRLEQNGVDYFFRSEEDILAELRAGEFLEAEVLHGQQVSGTSIRELEKAKKTNKVAIHDVDIGGALHIKTIKPDVILIMLLPPSFDEWQRRIQNRSEMPDQERRRRMATALRIFEAGKNSNNFNFVVSEDISESVKAIAKVVSGKSSPHEEKGKIVLEELFQRTKSNLQ